MALYKPLVEKLCLFYEVQQDSLAELLFLINRTEVSRVVLDFSPETKHFSPVSPSGEIGFASYRDNNCLCDAIVRSLLMGAPLTMREALGCDATIYEMARILRRFLELDDTLTEHRPITEVPEEGAMLGVYEYRHLQRAVERIKGLPLEDGWLLQMEGKCYAVLEYMCPAFGQELLLREVRRAKEAEEEDRRMAQAMEEGWEYISTTKMEDIPTDEVKSSSLVKKLRKFLSRN